MPQGIENMSTSARRRERSAFTLIELLVVISIVALLVAVLLPVLGRTREIARRAICASNQHQIAVAIHMYADQNKRWMFAHWNSIVTPTSAYWTEGDPNFIPWEQRESPPVANASITTNGNWQWSEMGGTRRSGGFFDGLYPAFLASGKVFDCPSTPYYPFRDFGYYAGWEPATKFETSMGPYLLGQSGGAQYWCSYIGNVFGRNDQKTEAYGHGFWSSYYVQGYYPYQPEYQSSVGALMWETGSRGFWLGATGSVTQGNHLVGGNEVFIDGSVRWKPYPWIAAEY